MGLTTDQRDDQSYAGFPTEVLGHVDLDRTAFGGICSLLSALQFAEYGCSDVLRRSAAHVSDSR